VDLVCGVQKRGIFHIRGFIYNLYDILLYMYKLNKIWIIFPIKCGVKAFINNNTFRFKFSHI
jgi:hypothetical protein